MGREREEQAAKSAADLQGLAGQLEEAIDARDGFSRELGARQQLLHENVRVCCCQCFGKISAARPMHEQFRPCVSCETSVGTLLLLLVEHLRHISEADFEYGKLMTLDPALYRSR